MKLNEMYPSRFLKAEDFDEGATFVLTIKDVQMEEIGQVGKKENKPVAYFVGTDKALVLNKTNALVISQHLGDDTDEWVGKKVAFTTVWVDSFGEQVRAIRVKTKQNGAPKPPPVPVVEDDADLFADEPAAQSMNLPAGDVVSRNRQTA